MFKRLVVSGSLATALLVGGTASVAMAHECVISSRSEQGNAGALHSSRWATLTTADVFGFIHEFLGGDPLTPEQIAWAVGAATDAGIPSSWVVRSDKTIGEGSHNPNLANGKGLDHLEDLYGEAIVGLYFEALGH